MPTVVNPTCLTAAALDTTSPRTRIRHAYLDREFGVGRWEEVFVDLVLGGGTVRTADGTCWDWYVPRGQSYVTRLPA